MIIPILVIIGGWVTLAWLVLRCPQRQGLGSGWSRNSYGMSSHRWLEAPTPDEMLLIGNKIQKARSWAKATRI